MNVKKKKAGSLEDPNLVPSLFDVRLVGCICMYNFYLFILHGSVHPLLFFCGPVGENFVVFMCMQIFSLNRPVLLMCIHIFQSGQWFSSWDL